ncbi:MAG: hypothetical protein EXS36_14180 [Pedosphaera sp.]|nr:hypothetical protein [Pedosphaera sp.]
MQKGLFPSALRLALGGFLASVGVSLAIHAATFPLPVATRQTEFPLKRPTVTGTVVAWGANDYGQTNEQVGLHSVVAIAADRYHTVALKSDGTVVAWGENGNDQVKVPSGLSGVVAIAAGSSHTVALKSNGTVVAWGRNDYGQVSVPVA